MEGAWKIGQEDEMLDLTADDVFLYEIASALGFYDEFHFSQQFKKITGISQKEYKSGKTSD